MSNSPIPHSPIEKTLLNRYSFIPNGAIGHGSFSKVYRGVDTETDLPIAVKRVDMTKLKPQSRARIIEEIKICTTLHHENIVETYAVDADDRYMYIIMELCGGGNLSKHIKDGMKEVKARYYMIQLVRALKYLADRNIYHRDLKPDNILLSPDNKRLSLCDFGFSTVLQQFQKTNTLCGTPLYIAPEIRDNITGYSNKSDLWSLGCIIYECLYGNQPFDSVNSEEELIKAQRMPIVYPKSTILSNECIDLLHGLLQSNPDLRITWTELFQHPWLTSESPSHILPLNLPAFASSRPIPIGGNSGAITGSAELLQLLANSPARHDQARQVGVGTPHPYAVAGGSPSRRYTPATSPVVSTGPGTSTGSRKTSNARPSLAGRAVRPPYPNASISLEPYLILNYEPSISPPSSQSRDGGRSDPTPNIGRSEDGPIVSVKAPSLLEERRPDLSATVIYDDAIKREQPSPASQPSATLHSVSSGSLLPPASLGNANAYVGRPSTALLPPDGTDASLGIWGLLTSSIRSLSIFRGGGK